MVDMKLTDEQLELKNLVKEFCDKELRPIAVECDRKSQTDPAGCFPIEVLKAASKLGLRTLGLSRELGGRDLDSLYHFRGSNGRRTWFCSHISSGVETGPADR